MTEYVFKCLTCNAELGNKTEETPSPPTTCPECNGTRVATQEVFVTEDKDLSFEMTLFNNTNAEHKTAGFMLNVEEQKLEGKKLKEVMAKKMAEAVLQFLTDDNLGTLIKGKVMK